MASESEIIIAFLFKRSGKKALSSSEFYLTLSMDLNWFTPKQAKDFLKKSIDEGLILEDDEKIKANFDLMKISVPVGFYPSKKVFEEKPEIKPVKTEDILEEMINKIVNDSGLNEKDVIGKIKAIEKEKNISVEVAALLLGKSLNVSLDMYFGLIGRFF